MQDVFIILLAFSKKVCYNRFVIRKLKSPVK